MFAYCNNNPIILVDDAGQGPAIIWYYLFLNSEFGLLHKMVQAQIVANSGGRIVSEVTLIKKNGCAGRADLFDNTTKTVWEIKHGNASIPIAFAQVTGYLGGTIHSAKASGTVMGYGAAGAFHDFFWISCLGTSFLVYYYTPTPGVVIYEVREIKKLDNSQPDHVYSPKMIKKPEPALAYAVTYSNEYMYDAAGATVTISLIVAAGMLLYKSCSMSGGGQLMLLRQ